MYTSPGVADEAPTTKDGAVTRAMVVMSALPRCRTRTLNSKEPEEHAVLTPGPQSECHMTETLRGGMIRMTTTGWRALTKRAPLLLPALMLTGFVLGCGGAQESIVPTVASRAPTQAEIDADPLALLPGGVVGFARIEAPEAFRTAFGPNVLQLARQLAPLPPSSGFVMERDLERVFLGFYSIQGADLAGVAVGHFDLEAIRAAAQSALTPTAGASLVQSPYAGQTLYTVSNMGFCVLTARTALFGSETGIRRALDRIREGRAQRRLPTWTNDLLDSKQAPIGLGIDLRANALSDTIR